MPRPSYISRFNKETALSAIQLAESFMSDFALNPDGNIQAEVTAKPSSGGPEVSIRYTAKLQALYKASIRVSRLNDLTDS